MIEVVAGAVFGNALVFLCLFYAVVLLAAIVSTIAVLWIFTGKQDDKECSEDGSGGDRERERW